MNQHHSIVHNQIYCNNRLNSTVSRKQLNKLKLRIRTQHTSPRYSLGGVTHPYFMALALLH